MDLDELMRAADAEKDQRRQACYLVEFGLVTTLKRVPLDADMDRAIARARRELARDAA